MKGVTLTELLSQLKKGNKKQGTSHVTLIKKVILGLSQEVPVEQLSGTAIAKIVWILMPEEAKRAIVERRGSEKAALQLIRMESYNALRRLKDGEKWPTVEPLPINEIKEKLALALAKESEE